MKKQQVWMMMHNHLISPNCRCVKNEWDFQIKHNGVYRAFLEVLGVNFSEKYSSVVHDITFHVLLLMVTYFGFFAKIVNIKTASLYVDLEEKIYLECPQVLSDIGRDDMYLQPCLCCKSVP